LLTKAIQSGLRTTTISHLTRRHSAAFMWDYAARESASRTSHSIFAMQAPGRTDLSLYDITAIRTPWRKKVSPFELSHIH